MVGDLLGYDMLYYTFKDFMRKREHIKENLKDKDVNYILTYRMYVEARPWMKDYYRGCIWDYLMGYMTEEDLLVEYDKYVGKYGDSGA